MSKQVTVLSDGYFSENQVKALLIEEDNNDAKVVLIDLGNVQKLETEVESLVGEIAVICGPRAFGLERAVLFQFLCKNKNIYQYRPSYYESFNVGKWTWLAPDAFLSKTASVGAMCHIGSHSVIGAGVRISNFSWIDDLCSIAPATELKKHTVCFERVKIGAGSTLGPYVALRQDLNCETKIQGIIDEPIFQKRAYIVTVE